MSIIVLHSPCACFAFLQVDGSSEVLAGIDGLVTKLLLDSQNLVELCKTLRSCWGTGLDLSSSETNYEKRQYGLGNRVLRL